MLGTAGQAIITTTNRHYFTRRRARRGHGGRVAARRLAGGRRRHASRRRTSRRRRPNWTRCEQAERPSASPRRHPRHRRSTSSPGATRRAPTPRGRAPWAIRWRAARGPRRSAAGSSPWSARRRSGPTSSPTWGRRSCGAWTSSCPGIRCSAFASWWAGSPAPRRRRRRGLGEPHDRRRRGLRAGIRGPGGEGEASGPTARAWRRRGGAGPGGGSRGRTTPGGHRGRSATVIGGACRRLPEAAPLLVDENRRFAAIFPRPKGRPQPQVLIYSRRQVLPAPHHNRPAPRPL